jgi:hypothetical protein
MTRDTNRKTIYMQEHDRLQGGKGAGVHMPRMVMMVIMSVMVGEGGCYSLRFWMSEKA